MNTYSIIIQVTYEIGGEFDADTAAEAIDQARLEIRNSGNIVGETIERAVLVPRED